MSEINLAWQKVNETESLHTRFRADFEASRFVSSNNRLDSPIGASCTQYGGTLLGAINRTSYRITESGHDERNLGRWSWLSLQGRNGTFTRIMSVYRPVKSQGATCTYQQQVAALAQAGLSTCPRQLFFDDLALLLDTWIQQGDRVIVGGDFNEPVQSHHIQTFFARFLMKEVLTSTFGNTAPNTYDGTRAGSAMIDGIFCSSSMDILATGMTPFAWGIASDHRMLWLDIEQHQFYGGTAPPKLWQPRARKLKLEDPRIVDRYVNRKLLELSKKNCISRLRVIYDHVCTGNSLTSNMKRELNLLDKERVKASLIAESRCRRIKTGNVQWSPELQQAINKIRYYRSCVRKYKYNKDISSRSLTSQFQLQSGPAVYNSSDAITHLQLSMKEYNLIKPQAEAIRYNFLADLAEAQAKAGDGDRSKYLAQLQHKEKQRKLGRKLKSIKGYSSTGVTTVSEDQDGANITYHQKEDIETCCINEGIRKRSQALTTPCFESSQLELFGRIADTPAVNQILQGQLSSETQSSIHPELVPLLPFWKRPTNISDINLDISLEEYKSGWKKQREQTTSGGELHFGHFKASIYNNSLADFDRMFLEIAFKTGHILPRWKFSTDVMIPKKVESHNVKDLRTICLLAADWNFGNKFLARRIMYNAECAHSIAPEQYGSRKNKSAIQHATNKALLFDIQRQRKSDASLMILDAESCYDRIPLHIASLSLQRQGLPLTAATFMFLPISSMTHKVRTSFGTSTKSFHSQTEKLHGILQGNGAGPCIWVMVCSPLLEHLKSSGHGIRVRYSDTGIIYLVPAFAFVDDIDIVERTCGLMQHPLSNAQEALTIWSRDLNAIGGNLKWSKCFWQWLLHKWTPQNRWKLQSIQENDHELLIRTADNNVIRLERKDIHEATLALGIMFSVDGSMTDEVNYLQSKAIKWSDQIRTKSLTRNETWYALNASIMRTITYPLMATSMTNKEINSIMTPLLQTALPKFGVCRNFPRDMVFSSKSHRGLGIIDPSAQQGMEKIMILLGESSPSTTCLLLRESVALCQQQCGLGPTFLSQPFTKSISSYVTKGIVTSLWEFCTSIGFTLTQPKRNRKHFSDDNYIMSRILALHPSNLDLKDINACRLFLQVETISDLLQLDGTAIRHDVWNGIQFQSLQNWPKQPSPNASAWNSWRRYLVQLIPSDNQGIFYQPLILHYWDYSYWPYFLSTDHRILYKRCTNNTFQLFHLDPTIQQTRRSDLIFCPSNVFHSVLPTRCHPCNIQQQGILLTVYSFSRAFNSSSHHGQETKWTDTVSITVNGDLTALKNSLLTGNLVIVSDGSFKNGYATGAYIITSLEHYNQHFITGTVRATGNANYQDSYRAELAGLLAGCYHLQVLLELWQLQDLATIVTIGCDNQAALEVSFNTIRHSNISPDYDHFDLIQSIRSLQLQNIKMHYRHIKGHQDNVSTKLDTYELLNVQMDSLSKIARLALEEQDAPKCWNATLPSWSWKLSTDQTLICKNVRKVIRNHASLIRTQRFLSHKQIVPPELSNSIDWKTIDSAMKVQSIGRARWITKHTVGMCGVNLWRERWKDRTHNTCPRCSSIETSQHVYLCQADAVVVQWVKELKDLKLLLEDLNTSPDISTSIINNLNVMYNGGTYDNSFLPASLQSPIGWHNFFEGLWHVSWMQTQQQFLHDRQLPCSAKSWGTKIMDHLWAIQFRMWKHRNDVEHQNDREVLVTSFNNRIEEHILDGFDWVPESHRSLVSARELSHVKESNSAEYKRSWLRNITAIQKLITNPPPPVQLQAPAPLLDRNQRNITEFFPPTIN